MLPGILVKGERMQREQVLKEAQSIQEWIVERRRQLHRHPELMYEEVKTSQLVRTGRRLPIADRRNGGPGVHW